MLIMTNEKRYILCRLSLISVNNKKFQYFITLKHELERKQIKQFYSNPHSSQELSSPYQPKGNRSVNSQSLTLPRIFMNSNCQWSFTRVQSQALPLVEQTRVCDTPNQRYESGLRIRSPAKRVWALSTRPEVLSHTPRSKTSLREM